MYFEDCKLFHLLLFSCILKAAFHLAYCFLPCVKAFTFNQVPFVFISITLEVGHGGSCCDLYQRVFCLGFPLRVLQSLVLHLDL